jgi:broad specificity phosphatase PhoE
MAEKVVVCIRHGESTFNAAWRATGVDPLHFDAPLSAVGQEQVRRARGELAGAPVEVVLTSPLTRAMQTAFGEFGDHPRGPPIRVLPLLRERVENSCDIGRSPAELAVDFPAADMSHLPDVWWHAAGAADSRGICIEPIPDVEARVARFRTEILARPEGMIAVVGHGTFFFHLTGKALANCEVVTL